MDAENHADCAAYLVDMCSEDLIRDPFSGYSRMREKDRLVRGILPGVDPHWIVTRYDDVKLVLSDPRFVNNPANVPDMRLQSLSEQMALARGYPPQYLKYRLGSLPEFDGAEHARLRRLVSQEFAARRIARLRPRIAEIAETLLDRLSGETEDGIVDLLPHFAYPLSMNVLCELVGIPEEDRPRWQEWSAALWSGAGVQVAPAMRDVIAYIEGLIERRRAEPCDDLLSSLIHVQDHSTGEGERLSDTELVSMVLMLNHAGHETTAHLIGNGVAALLTHPEQLALLRENPDLMPRAVNELLRSCGPILFGHPRYPTEDVEIGGVQVRKGEAVAPMLVGANHDPRVFGDPGRLDITRETEGRRETHVAFSHGAHHCLGATLARQEAEVAFEALLRRFPDLALGVDQDDLTHEPSPRHWRLLALPVRLFLAPG